MLSSRCASAFKRLRQTKSAHFSRTTADLCEVKRNSCRFTSMYKAISSNRAGPKQFLALGNLQHLRSVTLHTRTCTRSCNNISRRPLQLLLCTGIRLTLKTTITTKIEGAETPIYKS